jgi:hypothetical protein
VKESEWESGDSIGKRKAGSALGFLRGERVESGDKERNREKK